MATVNKTTRTDQTSFKKIPKTNLFTDYSVPTTKIEHTHTYNTENNRSVAPQPQPVQIIQQPAPQPTVEKIIEKESSSNDLMPILLMSLLSNNSSDVGAYAAPIPYPVYQPAPQYQPPPQIQQIPAPQPIQVQSNECKNCESLPYDIPYIKEKLNELKKLISEFNPVANVDKDNNITFDDSELRKLIEKRFDENWDKLLEIEARLIELQNEHYDIYNLLDSQEEIIENEVVEQDNGQDDEYEEIIETTTTSDPGYVDNNEYYEETVTTTNNQEYENNNPGYVDNNEYYEETVTTTNNQEYENNSQGYVEEQHQQPIVSETPQIEQNIEVKDYHMDKDNYKRFMNTLKSDVKK